jgi:hypothetical protein
MFSSANAATTRSVGRVVVDPFSLGMMTILSGAGCRDHAVGRFQQEAQLGMNPAEGLDVRRGLPFDL